MLLDRAPRRVYVNEVAVRDGFQSEPHFVPTDEKIRLIDGLSRTGLAKIEVTSFVSPKAIPHLRDAAEVMAGITRKPGVIYVALVPPLKLGGGATGRDTGGGIGRGTGEDTGGETGGDTGGETGGGAEGVTEKLSITT